MEPPNPHKLVRRFQQFDTAQLILEAASKGSSQASTSSRPQEIENQNEILLPEPSYTGPVQVINDHPIFAQRIARG